MRLKLLTRAIVERTPTPRPIRGPVTVERYYELARTGEIEPDARVELIEGEVVEMPPIGSLHGSVVEHLNALLICALGDRALVRPQLPVRLGNLSEPEPDIAVVRLRSDRYARSHPTANDVFLLVEISNSTLRYDIDVKVPLYARHGVPEVWVVDLKSRRIRTYRSPSEGRYQDTASITNPGTIVVPGVAEATVDLSELLTDSA